nr:putative ribonuclease H-like domain-containing protein [Tanacetum cinerariifolium]
AKIHVDNESAIYVVKNLVYHSKTKHTKIKYHFIRESYEKRLNEMVKIHTDSNVTDLLTKAFDVTRFQFLVASIGIEFKGYLLNDGYADLVQHAVLEHCQFQNSQFYEALHPIVDGKAVVISESLVRSDLLFDDKDDEAVNQNEGDRVERAITIDASLEAAQDSDNILKTQTMTMSNVEIPHGIDTGGSPKRQETMGGIYAQTMSERVLQQPNEPPLTEGHTSGSGEGRLEENIELTNIVLTPHDSPLTRGYTLGSDEGRVTLAELMETCTTLSNRVTQLENKLSTTKAVYNKAFITLTNKVKKLESQLKKKRSSAIIHSSGEEGPIQETAKHSKDDDDETLTETLLNIKRSLAKYKGKGIMQEKKLPKKLKKKEMIQLSLDEELAQKFYTEELAKKEARQEHERYNLEKALELRR